MTWYTQLMGQAQVEMNGDDIRSASSDDCSRCEEMADLADGLKDSYRPAVNPYADVTDSSVLKWGSSPSARAEVSIPEHKALDGESGEEVADYEAEDIAILYRLAWSGSTWKVTEVELALGEFSS